MHLSSVQEPHAWPVTSYGTAHWFLLLPSLYLFLWGRNLRMFFCYRDFN